MNNETTNATAAAPAASEELAVLTTIKALRDGEFIDELNDALQETINAVSEVGKPATLTITLSITPAGRTVVIADTIKPKTPVRDKDATIFFLGTGNALTRTDPKQAKFPVEAGFTGRAAVNG